MPASPRALRSYLERTRDVRPGSPAYLAGVPVHVVAARLGHADPSITLRVYAHVISDQLTEAADIFARAIADMASAAVSNGVSKMPLPSPGGAFDLGRARRDSNPNPRTLVVRCVSKGHLT